MNYAVANGIEYPYKKTYRCTKRIEKLHKIDISKAYEIDQDKALLIIFEFFKEGHLIEKKEFPWKDIDQMLDTDAEAEESIIDQVGTYLQELAGKQNASSSTEEQISQ